MKAEHIIDKFELASCSGQYNQLKNSNTLLKLWKDQEISIIIYNNNWKYDEKLHGHHRPREYLLGTSLILDSILN